MKPWEELTDIEKREAIARRLGIKLESDAAGHWVAKTTDTHWWLPKDWPTNDGLAFAEVWPKLILQVDDEYLALRLSEWEDGKPSVPTVSYLRTLTAGNLWEFRGATWADAICRAAYELLPQNSS